MTKLRYVKSFSLRMRRRRMQLFKSFIAGMPRPVKILDVGGTVIFWEMTDFLSPDYQITLLNLDCFETHYPNMKSISGNATNMPEFADKEFDIVFSNSVIEHVGSFAKQLAMANEIRRIGLSYFVQTPNYYFPMEPHFIFPGFHWLPLNLRIKLVNHFQLGWMPRAKNIEDAKEIILQIRLIKEKDLRILFPEAAIAREKFCGLSKSLIATHKQLAK